MGRFRYLYGPDDDENDHEETTRDEPERQHWEFVADPGMERALVRLAHNNNQQQQRQQQRYHQEDLAHSSNSQPPPPAEAVVPPQYNIYFFSSAPPPSHEDDEDEDDIVLVDHPNDEIQQQRRCYGGGGGASSSSFSSPSRVFLLMSSSVLVALLAWWIRMEGPPGPPPLILSSTRHGKQPHRFHPADGFQAPASARTAAASAASGDTTRQEVREASTLSPLLLTWKEFFTLHSHQLTESVAALFYYTPLHVLQWWFRWIQVLGHEQVQRIRRQLSQLVVSDYFKRTSSWSVSDTCQPSSLQLLHTTFVGQRRAVQAVMDAVQAWNQPYHPETMGRLDADHDSIASAPLLLYFTGMTSSGKVTLAKQLAHALCATPILVLTPYFDLDVDVAVAVAPSPVTTTPSSQADSLLLLVEQHKKHQRRIEARIRQHVQQYPRSMILLEDVDEMAHIVQWLGQELAEPNKKKRPEEDTEYAGAPNEPPSLRFVCRHAIVVFTSTVAGSRSIARLDPAIVAASATDETSISDSSIINNDDPSFLLNIQHEMDAYFQTAISQWMDAVVPFLPITPMHLQVILRRKVAVLSEEYASSSNETFGQDPWRQSGTSGSTGGSPSSDHPGRMAAWSALTISDAAVEALLHPSRIEYLSWKQKSSQSQTTTTAGGSGSVLTFSSAGVSVLSDKSMVLNKIRALIHACLANDDDSTNDETSRTTLPARSERSKQPAVLDVTAVNPKELVLKWCRDGNGKVDQSCSTECRTSLS